MGADWTYLEHGGQSEEGDATAAIRKGARRRDPGNLRPRLCTHHDWVAIPSSIIRVARFLHVPQQCIEEQRPCSDNNRHSL